MVLLDYRDARPIYTQISDGFREQIIAGILRPGEKLPSVRELATQLTINPNTIQRSYRELEVQGWIASVPGKGSFVCGVPLDGVPENSRLMAEFDQLADKLRALGMTNRQLHERIDKGGSNDA